jgi:NADPH:quinone reductase-like Zn-dependent oxidoreductase
VTRSTAYAAVRAVALNKDETAVVSGAAGGVGSLAVQLARRAGATVIGLAREANHQWLAGHGVIPVTYGDGVADRIRQAASKVDAFFDTFGAYYVELALDLGVEPSRIDTIANFAWPRPARSTRSRRPTAGSRRATSSARSSCCRRAQRWWPGTGRP